TSRVTPTPRWRPAGNKGCRAWSPSVWSPGTTRANGAKSGSRRATGDGPGARRDLVCLEERRSGAGDGVLERGERGVDHHPHPVADGAFVHVEASLVQVELLTGTPDTQPGHRPGHVLQIPGEVLAAHA